MGWHRQHQEQALRAIRIPLERGMMGFRKFTLIRTLKNKFDEVHTLKDLQQYKACLGRDWPDVKILQNSGLPVVLFDHYEELFKQVKVLAPAIISRVDCMKAKQN
ncbi:MAG: hypothetical protein U5L01_04020 [Rheinheimera sp.]|nr:hypothetical protein [Rheinheimera sp.]